MTGILHFLVITVCVVTVVELADVDTGITANVQDACLQPKDGGPCKALFPRYFYNKETFACEMFNYGGCLGNDNNFETLVACQIKCTGLIVAKSK